MVNQTIFQCFHWFHAPEEQLWKKLKNMVPWLESLGITKAWLPPAFKSANGQHEPGYAVYDLYDLGEFDQKGSIPTRYGTKDEYIELVRELKSKNILPIADLVFNHKLGGDESEMVPAREVNKENRNEFLTEEMEMEAYTKFYFPGRQGKYSDFVWDWKCFSGFDCDGKIYQIQSEWTQNAWDYIPDDQFGNYDFLLGCDVEFRNPFVREELFRWLDWYIETTGISSFRLDAVKHMNPEFSRDVCIHVKERYGEDNFMVGEYIKHDVGELIKILEYCDYKMQLFDFPLHYNLKRAADEGQDFDLRTIFDGTLTQAVPTHSISFIDNHDTMPLEAMDSFIPEYFRPTAYSLILLWEHGIPVIFYPDIVSLEYEKEGTHVVLNEVFGLQEMIKMRNTLAYGFQREYFSAHHLIGWTRPGKEGNGGCAVIISYDPEAAIEMEMGEENKNRRYKNFMNPHHSIIETDNHGKAVFQANENLLSIWIPEEFEFSG